MRRTALKPRQIYDFAREFVKTSPNSVNTTGRPRTFDDALIITIACIQNLHMFSFREALEYSEDYFIVPTLSTYHYRLEKIPSSLIKGFVEYLGDKISKQKSVGKLHFFVMDGTGFSFHDVYPMKLFRGTEIRKIKSHVKTAALIGVFGKNKRFVISAKTGPPYSSEIKLIEPILSKIKQGEQGSYVLGDKGFDCIRILDTIQKNKCIPAIAIKNSRFYGIKDSLRKVSDKNSRNSNIYNKRTLIEGLFGNIKQKLSSHVRIFKLETAETFTLLRFALYNMYILSALQKTAEEAVLWVLFSNSLYTP